jgi:hypothetical protein
MKEDINSVAKTPACHRSVSFADAKTDPDDNEEEIYSRRGSLIIIAREKGVVNGDIIGAPCESQKELKNLSLHGNDVAILVGTGVLSDRYSIESVVVNRESHSDWNGRSWAEQVSLLSPFLILVRLLT